MKSILFLASLILLISKPACAQSDRLIAYLAEATENNPQLKAGFSSYQAALARVSQAGYLPDPELTLGLFVRPMHRFMGTQRAEFTLTQMFPWFGTLDAAKSETSARAKAVFDRFRQAVSEVQYEVQATYYAIYLLEQKTAITEEYLGILEQLERTARTRFGGGSSGTGSTSSQAPGGLVNVLRVQMERNALQNEVSLLRDGRRPLEARFNALLGRPLNAAVVVEDSVQVGQPPIPIAEIPDSIRRHNPLLSMLAMEMAASDARAQKNTRMGFPIVGVGLRYSLFSPRDGSTLTNNGRDMVMPTLKLTLPIWRAKYEASVKEAREQKADAASLRIDRSNQLQASYEEVMRDFRDAERRVALYQRQAGLADQAQRILTVQYASGGGDFDEVLRMQLKSLDFQLQAVNAVVDQNIAVAMLARLMGR